MNRQDQIKTLFEGKTIKSVDCSNGNCWTFYFTDGTNVEIDTCALGFGLYGPCIWLPDGMALTGGLKK